MEKKLIKIEIKNRWTGKVLFEYEKENNTIKETVVEAVNNDANLRGANLVDANLVGADLRDADLRGADLRYADLRYADLRCANLVDANLVGADLRYADLEGANLVDADLRCANLVGANLVDADLVDADLVGAKNVPYIPMACPSDGAFIGWKKVREDGLYLVKLEICEDSKRSSASRTKCRCDKAKVLQIVDIKSGKEVQTVTNTKFVDTEYKVGSMVYADEWDDNRWNECSHGIHFFINRQEAEEYDV